MPKEDKNTIIIDFKPSVELNYPKYWADDDPHVEFKVDSTRDYIKNIFKKPKKSGMKDFVAVEKIILEPDKYKDEAIRTECTSILFENGDYCLYFHKTDSRNNVEELREI